MITQKKEDRRFIVLAILWVAIFALGITKYAEIGFYLAVLLEVLYCLPGCIHKDTIKKKSMVYPLAIWGIMMVVCVTGLWVWQHQFGTSMPSFTILGLHPSFAVIVLLFWIGSVLCWSVGLWVNREDWLSQSDWDEFMNEIKAIDEKGEKG